MEDNIIDQTVRFIEAYNRIGYGKARVVETDTNFVIELYNAGYSENEEMESQFIRGRTIRYYVSLNYHPIKLLVIRKNPLFETSYSEKDGDKFRVLDCYEKKKKYLFKLNIN